VRKEIAELVQLLIAFSSFTILAVMCPGMAPAFFPRFVLHIPSLVQLETKIAFPKTWLLGRSHFFSASLSFHFHSFMTFSLTFHTISSFSVLGNSPKKSFFITFLAAG
jgi:hypothetical protein